ncbi:hypothetical protein Cri9333_0349 [Crinalium epipsammum PCC 9333]|uniref:Uncharacterized protein n=1 Tax=Crinalium epipsammum PCC 9333 TaxID=1173022 RepID=K9VVY0_9CYAN|nr:hypothetical protein [Crinalium epipsammum]AFZ11330.1 hypothetical protein Cri9333_0349 [Crinalium epipsammum PCC 9333]
MAKITAMPSNVENAIKKLINPGEGVESDSSAQAAGTPREQAEKIAAAILAPHLHDEENIDGLRIQYVIKGFDQQPDGEEY